MLAGGAVFQSTCFLIRHIKLPIGSSIVIGGDHGSPVFGLGATPVIVGTGGIDGVAIY